MPPSFVLSLSGGLDSAVLCAHLAATHGRDSVSPIFFRYPSKHNAAEEKAARAVAGHFSLKLEIIDLSSAFAGISGALLAHDDADIPQGAYAADTMAATLVPGRNLIFASVAAALAESRGRTHVALATHGGDHFLYPDCRPSFNVALDAALRESSDGKVGLATPFSHMSKAGIVTLGLELHVPFALTRSCYTAGAKACGICGTCRERLEAFAENGVEDSAEYEKKAPSATARTK